MSTVLLVEDDPGNRMLIEDIFQFDKVGADLSIVESGEEALRTAGEMKPILILMDIRLPGIDGLETTRRLKSNPATRDIPIWALTAYAHRDDHDRAVAAGCDAYFRKPLKTDELVGRLCEFVKSCEPAGAASCQRSS